MGYRWKKCENAYWKNRCFFIGKIYSEIILCKSDTIPVPLRNKTAALFVISPPATEYPGHVELQSSLLRQAMKTSKILCTGRNHKGTILRMFAILLVYPGVGSPCWFPSFQDAVRRKRPCPQWIAAKKKKMHYY